LLAAIVAIVGLSSAIYIKEHLAKGKLASDLGLANDRFRLAVEASRSVGWEWDLKTGQDSWFGDLQTMFGIPADEFVGRTEDFYRYVHPEDRQSVAKAVADARQDRRPYASEFRVIRLDGAERWVSARGQFYYGAKGDPERMVGMAADITERKLAEVALSSVTRRVVEAEERERKRIAVDLHEDIGQRLALLANELEHLKTDTPSQSVDVRDRVDEVWKQTLDVLTDVKTSAHELHSPRLEYLGISTVMKCFCDEFGDRKKVEIHFRSHDVLDPLPPEISVCLFRVLQEALYNAVKHSGVLQFAVQLWGTPNEVHLTVSDSGVGFDFEAARKSGGLGLTRMEERLKLVQGTFSIDSQLTKGTTIRVGVPLKPAGNS
jgi:PAS domain S-box-containing protein